MIYLGKYTTSMHRNTNKALKSTFAHIGGCNFVGITWVDFIIFTRSVAPGRKSVQTLTINSGLTKGLSKKRITGH